METIAASVILEDAFRDFGLDPDDLDDRETAMGRTAFSQAVQELWERWWWEDLMVSRQTLFADGYVSREWGNGWPLYFPLTDKYYVSLWYSGAPPALAVGDSYANYTTPGVPARNPAPMTQTTDNLYDWAVISPRCWEQNALPTWNAQMTPNVGDQCLWNGVMFQWTVDAGALPNVQPDPASRGLNPFFPTLASNPGWMPIFGAVSVSTLFQVQALWNPQLPFVGAVTGALQGVFGKVRFVAQRDPRVTPAAHKYHLRKSDDGTGETVLGLNTGRPWVLARRLTPSLTGDPYDSTQAYDATPATELVFDS